MILLEDYGSKYSMAQNFSPFGLFVQVLISILFPCFSLFPQFRFLDTFQIFHGWLPILDLSQANVPLRNSKILKTLGFISSPISMDYYYTWCISSHETNPNIWLYSNGR